MGQPIKLVRDDEEMTVYGRHQTAVHVAQGWSYADEADEANAAPTLPLPEDFPGRKELAAAGISHVENVPRDEDGLTAVRGIGPATAAEILEALAE